MYPILVDSTTPPPLMLALRLLEGFGTKTTTDSDTPLVQSYGRTNIVDNVGLSKIAGAPIRPLDVLPFLMLLGQMAWRYMPALLELDSRGTRDYMIRRRLTTVLPDGSDFKSLDFLATDDVQSSIVPRTSHLAKYQRNSDRFGPPKRTTDEDYRFISDYVTNRLGQRSLVTDSGSFTLPFKMFLKDVNAQRYADIDEALNNIQTLADRKWPFLTLGRDQGPPPVIARGAMLREHLALAQSPMQRDTSPLHALTGLKGATSLNRRMHDQCLDHNPFVGTTVLRTGPFFTTPLFNAILEPMPEQDFGQVDLSRKPYVITLNARMTYPRVQLSLVHEMLHVLDEMHKLNLPHDAIHELAIMLVDDVLPAVSALAEYTNNALFTT